MPLPPPPPPMIQLSRKTKFKIKKDGLLKKYTINYKNIKIDRLLGKGTFGVVYKAYHFPSKLTFVVKVREWAV